MRKCAPPENTPKTHFYELLRSRLPPGTLPKPGGSAREVPRTPSDNSINFFLSPEGPPWTAKSSPGARKHYKNQLFFNIFKIAPNPLREPSGTPKKRVRRPEGPRGPLPKTRTDFFEAPRAPLDAQRELWSRFSIFFDVID